MEPLQPERLMAAARARTGLEDFGDGAMQEGLAVYCESAANEAALNELGIGAVAGNVVTALANRLRIVDWARRHPWVRHERIDAPIVVVGMFRAGTTLFSYLLDQDPCHRPLLRWEAHDSVPPPALCEHRAGPRVDAVRAGAAAMDQLNPNFKAIHHEDADGPTECIAVMGQDFKSLLWESITNVPSYARWLRSVDQRSAYDYHRLVLQVLQSAGTRGRWTLKSPHHALALDDLIAVYPDAKLVVLHRDPVVLCASVCSLITTLSGTFTSADHHDYIAQHWPATLAESVRRHDAFRDEHPEHPVLDLHYAELVRDPLAVIERLYAWTGESFTETVEANVARYVAGHPKGQFGAHRYDLSEFGLDAGELAERFSGYVDRYGIEREHRAG